jgi:RsiW-degrading membrane proteinase PrsW (M82 family)
VLEDWIWYAILPFIGYAALTAAGLVVRSRIEDALFIAGGATLMLLLIGIHNAWDTVTHIVAVELRKDGGKE